MEKESTYPKKLTARKLIVWFLVGFFFSFIGVLLAVLLTQNEKGNIIASALTSSVGAILSLIYYLLVILL
jgi:hypothetical protein